jgi:hypothetical protein
MTKNLYNRKKKLIQSDFCPENAFGGHATHIARSTNRNDGRSASHCDDSDVERRHINKVPLVDDKTSSRISQKLATLLAQL